MPDDDYMTNNEDAWNIRSAGDVILECGGQNFVYLDAEDLRRMLRELEREGHA